MKRILGVDVDGVLADFNSSFIELVIKTTGRDLFPPRPFDIPVWNYPEYYGYTFEETTTVWGIIEESTTFWQSLSPYPETHDAMRYLRDCVEDGADVYFVTSRPGRNAKVQTERWLRKLAIVPTVLISGAKGLCARGLQFTAYIDDRWENALDVAQTNAQTVLINRPWNQSHNAEEFGIKRTTTVVGFADAPVADGDGSARA